MEVIHDSEFHAHISADPLEVRPRGPASATLPRGVLVDAPAGVDRRRVTGTTFEGSAAYTGGMQTGVQAITAGLAAIRFGPVNPGEHWLVERIALKSQSAPATLAFVYVVGSGYPLGAATAAEPIPDAYLVDATLTGNLDVADENTPILVPGGHELVIVWTGLTAAAAARCSANVQHLVEAV